MKPRLLILVLAATAFSCGGDSTTAPTPPSSSNTPPQIASLTSSSPRVEAEQEVTLTATVTDAETNPSQLTYAWSVSPAGGLFTGSGREVRWRAPRSAPTPGLYTITLTVTESYVSGGAQRTNQVSGSAQVRYNDPIAEVTDISSTFLNDFMNDGVSAAQAVRNFSDSCPGKAQEQQDVQNVRNLFRAQGAQFSFSSIVVDTPRTSAVVTAACTFRSIRRSDNQLEVSPGTCRLTAVYEPFRWWLCDSRFFPQGTAVPTSLGRLLSIHLEP
jgi:hypothetical protein